MDMNMTNIYNFIDSQEEQAMKLWENLVRIESWSQDVGRVNQVAAHLDTYFSAMGLNTRKYIFENAGSSLAAFNRPAKLPGIALLAHMDTVHKPGSFGDDLFRRDGEYVYGPGAYDCKGGIAIAVLVMKALMAFGYDKRQLKLILSGDEEVAHSLSGGKGIDVYTEEIAGCAAAFNCESGLLNGDVVTRRKGGGIFKIQIHGVSAHSGRNPQDGANAIREAASKIMAIEALTDYEGTTFNCGRIQGGTSANVVPDYCEFLVSIRFQTNADCDEAIKKLQQICDHNEDSRISSEMSVTAMFRAMEYTPKTNQLFDIYSKACESLGYPAPAAIYSGGCSDSAYIAMEGIPVLCGVGVRGSDNHSPKERAVAASICEQAKKIVTAILMLDDDF